MALRLRIVLLSVLVLLSGWAQASGVARFQAYLAATQSLQAEFEQEVFDRTERRVSLSKGEFSLQRPGKFRWIYAAPTEQLIVGDGVRVWIYDRDLAQVTVRRMAQALGSSPAALLAGGEEVTRAFTFSEAGSRDGLDWLDARPQGSEAGFEQIRLGFDAAGIRAMELVDHFGQRTVLRFSDLRRNLPLEAALFRFQPPPGVDVLGTP